jgi:hypothetical protein
MSASSLAEEEVRLEAAAAPVTVAEPWSLAKRVLFRFGFAYFVLFNLPSPLDYIPGLRVGSRRFAGLRRCSE